MSTHNGRKLGKYEIVERLAQGGMAEVYIAHQPGVERTVVVKVLHYHLANADSFVARFRREARAIGSLQHPNIVRIIDFDTQDDLQYMVMDYVQGGTLSDQLKNGRKLLVGEALHLGEQLASALVYAHKQGIIHRDIKPGNILFANANFDHPVLSDFGLAHLCSEDMSNLTVTGAMIGTPTYMSPEAVRGEKCDFRSDIYSLAVVLYELLTGKPPYVANSPYSMMMKLANDPLPAPRTLNPDLPEEIEAILLKALAKEPGERYQSAAEFAEALKSAQLILQPEEEVHGVLNAKTLVKQENAAPPLPSSQPLPKQDQSLRKDSARSWIPFAFAVAGVGMVAFIMTEFLIYF